MALKWIFTHMSTGRLISLDVVTTALLFFVLHYKTIWNINS
ncbi:hypothetical protein [uncultured Methanolobus sp.]|nr:hypothetical protein [uncultured Methanolobus sp.]